jgi:hypothetical protein
LHWLSSAAAMIFEIKVVVKKEEDDTNTIEVNRKDEL